MNIQIQSIPEIKSHYFIGQVVRVHVGNGVYHWEIIVAMTNVWVETARLISGFKVAFLRQVYSHARFKEQTRIKGTEFKKWAFTNYGLEEKYFVHLN